MHPARSYDRVPFPFARTAWHRIAPRSTGVLVMSFYAAPIGIDGRTVRGQEMRNSESVIPEHNIIFRKQ
jgi:hypothetical protein